jgi:hypothetical protein
MNDESRAGPATALDRTRDGDREASIYILRQTGM